MLLKEDFTLRFQMLFSRYYCKYLQTFFLQKPSEDIKTFLSRSCQAHILFVSNSLHDKKIGIALVHCLEQSPGLPDINSYHTVENRKEEPVFIRILRLKFTLLSILNKKPPRLKLGEAPNRFHVFRIPQNFQEFLIL